MSYDIFENEIDNRLIITEDNADSTDIPLADYPPVKQKRKRKPWMYQSDCEALIDQLDHKWFWDCVKMFFVGVAAGLIVGIFGTLIFT